MAGLPISYYKCIPITQSFNYGAGTHSESWWFHADQVGSNPQLFFSKLGELRGKACGWTAGCSKVRISAYSGDAPAGTLRRERVLAPADNGGEGWFTPLPNNISNETLRENIKKQSAAYRTIGLRMRYRWANDKFSVATMSFPFFWLTNAPIMGHPDSIPTNVIIETIFKAASTGYFKYLVDNKAKTLFRDAYDPTDAPIVGSVAGRTGDRELPARAAAIFVRNDREAAFPINTLIHIGRRLFQRGVRVRRDERGSGDRRVLLSTYEGAGNSDWNQPANTTRIELVCSVKVQAFGDPCVQSGYVAKIVRRFSDLIEVGQSTLPRATASRRRPR